MLNHNPILFVLGYLLVAAVIIAVPFLREALLFIVQVLICLVFLAIILNILMEIWNSWQTRNKKL
ncbi:hypothetical protein KMC60_gp09 [Achromobacter phage vB_AxyP_19-32_Axy11]|uniref:Uncharacterized protein n=3 Tax=Pourcelvirus TaxID=2842976 RepID=A0A514CVZ9_9CAUD|nr:hypothetical protein KMC59_gp09 [Achromobacter phage vB_AxyP_19-32_Axy10]YP_010079380.1 hypothetical protein KMC60_gp09 [Achromobacter phage vB_AxyP_19-32_Axy11]QDH83986.1 hypothetical protein Axy10_009 [Achromobacter phage vB_AxyP_19-32_Axy10]QDH84067.1 hypothetical protein Axy11_009 [Achromobacter phage vB_AxyP_19-32_Axy11]QDH84660.1 hypothetical protein Axy22_008 [Achromobacter phage vB_AxyP_19-32_Axy22]